MGEVHEVQKKEEEESDVQCRGKWDRLTLYWWEREIENIKDVKVIPGKLQHRLVVTNLVKKKVKKVVRKEAIERSKVWKLKEDVTRARFEARVGELVSADAPDF